MPVSSLITTSHVSVEQKGCDQLSCRPLSAGISEPTLATDGDVAHALLPENPLGWLDNLNANLESIGIHDGGDTPTSSTCVSDTETKGKEWENLPPHMNEVRDADIFVEYDGFVIPPNVNREQAKIMVLQKLGHKVFNLQDVVHEAHDKLEQSQQLLVTDREYYDRTMDDFIEFLGAWQCFIVGLLKPRIHDMELETISIRLDGPRPFKATYISELIPLINQLPSGYEETVGSDVAEPSLTNLIECH